MRFAPILQFNCEHVLFVYILKQNKKQLVDFNKKFRGFSEFSKIKFCWRQIFKILIIHKPLSFPRATWGPTQNLGLIGSAVLTFFGYKQTDKLKFYIDNLTLPPNIRLHIIKVKNNIFLNKIFNHFILNSCSVFSWISQKKHWKSTHLWIKGLGDHFVGAHGVPELHAPCNPVPMRTPASS